MCRHIQFVLEDTNLDFCSIIFYFSHFSFSPDHTVTTATTCTMADVATAPHATPTSATNDDDDENLPSVHELLRAVALLQGVVRDIGAPADNALFEDDASPFTIYRSPSRGPRYYVDTRKQLASAPALVRGVSDPRPRGSSVLSEISPQKAGAYAAASGLATPPPKRRDGVASSVPRPGTRVAALTRANISLLPAPMDLGKRRNAAGSISGASQQSKTSVRTDGGAVFSRLYQSDYHKNRDQKLRAIRDRQEHLNLNFTFSPATNLHPNHLAKRLSISSMDSAGSASTIGSMQSAKTDSLAIGSVSSRLYDPDYVRKRNARLTRMREEREMRDCTFAPTINSAASVAAAASAAASAAAASRRTSSAHLHLK